MTERVAPPAREADLLAWLLAPQATALASEMDSLDACYATFEQLDAEMAGSIDRAAAGGFSSDRLGYAFVAGYRAALMRLAPHLSSGRASLCATEEGGAHPRAIHTTLTPQTDSRGGTDAFVLAGEKTFATLASHADTLLVVASTVTTPVAAAARNHLRVVAIPATRAGVRIAPRAPLPFAPEIPHARVTFDAVRVAPGEVLPGDGYDVVLKPFRTLEDEHVMAALLGHVVRLARASAMGPHPPTLEGALATLCALRDCASRDPLAPTTHLALTGILAQATRLAGELPLGHLDDATRARWERDLPLLAVAGSARLARQQAAYERLGLGGGQQTRTNPPPRAES